MSKLITTLKMGLLGTFFATLASCDTLDPRAGISDAEANTRFRCTGEARTVYGIGLEAEYKGDELAKAKVEADKAYESDSISGLLALETLSEKNRESIIASYDRCINGDPTALEEVKAELEAKKKS